jgi:hypothetical protein
MTDDPAAPVFANFAARCSSRGRHTSKATARKQEALERVLAYIVAHPGCAAARIGAALGLPMTTLNGYTLALRATGKVVAIKHRANIYGSGPDTYQPAPASGAAPAANPAPFRKKDARTVLKPAPPVQRMDLVAALFGPAGKGSP